MSVGECGGVRGSVGECWWYCKSENIGGDLNLAMWRSRTEPPY